MNPEQTNTPSTEDRSIQSLTAIDKLTSEKPTESNAIDIPSLSLPKGGGAIRGIDEKFEVNGSNGTAAFSLPLPISQGRNGFTPAISLSYNSGTGNSSFGLGWQLNFPSVQRKTDKALPRYREEIDEDVFMFTGAEDLVPYLEKEAGSENWVERTKSTPDGYTVKSYRPRLEGGFAKIEQIYHSDLGYYWKVTSRDNTATIFGRNRKARLADPENLDKVFQWLPEFSYDDKGNWIMYHYKTDSNLDEEGNPIEDESIPDHLYEKLRKRGAAPYTNTYLKRITYGNRTAYYADPDRPYDPQEPANLDYLFELVLDYGEHLPEAPKTEEEAELQWAYRSDAFSSYRSGFEIRTNRLCRRVLMFHHFEEEKQFKDRTEEMDFGRDYLVRSLELDYEPSSINDSGMAEVTYLKQIIQSGYIRKPDDSYSKKSLPPVEFSYQELSWNHEVKEVKAESIINAPVGLTNNYQWVDLYNEGISGILTEQAEGFYYKSNLGDVTEPGVVTFTPARQVSPKPVLSGLSTANLSIRDLESNGQKQIVVNNQFLSGYFELTDKGDWQPMKSFENLSRIDLDDPNLRLLDLNGDGQPELVLTQENMFVWYAADGKRGYMPAEFSLKSPNEDKGPAVVFSDQTQTVFLADMSGDGLVDIVRIRNGEIAYWANMGYGRFSSKISMGNAPIFDHPDQFNPSFLHLADISGTGTTDMVYVGENRIDAYINQSGNAWSEAQSIEYFPRIDANSKLAVIDLLGTGTSCIVWSSDLPENTSAPMRYIDLMTSKKPHVLIGHKNHMGKETHLEYKSSTYYFLKDKLEGQPWITKLPFPVQVVSRTVLEEKITDVRFASNYTYHHGYYDHAEREFRGFGRVEQTDTETYHSWKRNIATEVLETDESFYQPPVLTKTWYHTGSYLDRETILKQFKEEYWPKLYGQNFPAESNSVNEYQLQDAILTDDVINLSGDEFREALRACKGMVLRQEVFALDAPDGATIEQLQLQFKPYTVVSRNCHIQLLQPRAENKHGVFLLTENESMSISYERNIQDPRCTHSINVKIDELGNILESATVVYPRQLPVPEHPLKILEDQAAALNYEREDEKDAYRQGLSETRSKQELPLITYTKNSYSDDILTGPSYRLRLLTETETFEITGLTKAESDFLEVSDFDNILDATTLKYWESAAASGTRKRLIEHIQTTFYNNELDAELPLGQLAAHGLTYQAYQLALTPGLIAEIYSDKLPADPALLDSIFGTSDSDSEQADAKYHKRNNNWWIASGVMDYRGSDSLLDVQNRFYTPQSYTDPFGSTTRVDYYKDYHIFIERITDELEKEVEILDYNFRSLIATKLKDTNSNISEALLDELSIVKATALSGKSGEGDSLEALNEYDTTAENTLITSYFNESDSDQLATIARQLMNKATTRFVYDLDRYTNSEILRNEQPPADYEDSSCKRIAYQPAVVSTIQREVHKSDTTPLQLQFEFLEGQGNVVMAKVQAEPGDVSVLNVANDCTATLLNENTGSKLRWIGNGRTVLNNKGNPVKQYEPYFSNNPFFENSRLLVEKGVTPLLYYDALGRLIKTEHPDGSISHVEFDNWQQTVFDQNDNIENSPWYLSRKDGQLGQKEQEAAEKALKHGNTPSTLHLDTLGRPVLSIAHIRTGTKDQLGRLVPTDDEFYATQIILDIEGNTLAVLDAKANTVMSYKYNMLGHRLYQNSMDAGERWMLNNAMGNPVRSWDSRDFEFDFQYDELQRPVKSRVKGGPNNLDHVFEMIEYGDRKNQPIAERNSRLARNQLGRQLVLRDTSGLTRFLEYDFKGNLLESTKQFLQK